MQFQPPPLTIEELAALKAAIQIIIEYYSNDTPDALLTRKSALEKLEMCEPVADNTKPVFETLGEIFNPKNN